MKAALLAESLRSQVQRRASWAKFKEQAGFVDEEVPQTAAGPGAWFLSSGALVSHPSTEEQRWKVAISYPS